MIDWICETIALFCADHGENVTHSAPEISLGALALACVLMGGVLLIADEWRRGR